MAHTIRTTTMPKLLTLFKLFEMRPRRLHNLSRLETCTLCNRINCEYFIQTVAQCSALNANQHQDDVASTKDMRNENEFIFLLYVFCPPFDTYQFTQWLNKHNETDETWIFFPYIAFLLFTSTNNVRNVFEKSKNRIERRTKAASGKQNAIKKFRNSIVVVVGCANEILSVCLSVSLRNLLQNQTELWKHNRKTPTSFGPRSDMLKSFWLSHLRNENFGFWIGAARTRQTPLNVHTWSLSAICNK